VTLFAAIEVWRACELSHVDILVAVHTLCKFYLIQSISTLRDMAFCTLHLSMFFAQGKARLIVGGDGKCRRLESIDRVARLALATVFSLGELAIVRIGLMAVGAKLKRDDGFEISRLMASLARYLAMLTQQWIFRLRVVETLDKSRFFPTYRVMA
jgi:hypothetical protein